MNYKYLIFFKDYRDIATFPKNVGPFLFFIFIFFRVGGFLPFFLGSFSLTLRSLYNFYSLIKTCARALPPLLCTYAALSISSESML